MPDFSLASVPNFAQAALSGYKAGQSQGQQDRLDAALGSADLTRPETLLPVLRADPTTGVALIGAASKMADATREAAARKAQTDFLLAHYQAKGGGQSVSGSAPAAVPPASAAAVSALNTPPAPSPPAAAGAPADVVVTGPTISHPAMSPADEAYLRADPEGFMKAQGGFDQMQEHHLATAKAGLELETQLLGSATDQASYTRAIGLARQAGLDVSGVPAQYDPQWVGQMTQTALTAKQRLDHQLALRTADRADAAQAETVKQHGIENGLAGQRIALERQSVGIAGGHLALARNADARAAATAGKASGPSGVIPAPASKAALDALPSGAVFRAPDGSIRKKR